MRILPVLLLFTLLLGACATPPVVEEENDAAKPAGESFDSAQTVNEDGSITISILWDGEEIGTIEKEKPGDGYSVELMEERGSYAYFSVNVTGLGGYILYGGAHSVYEINPAEKLLVNIFEGTPGKKPRQGRRDCRQGQSLSTGRENNRPRSDSSSVRGDTA